MQLAVLVVLAVALATGSVSSMAEGRRVGRYTTVALGPEDGQADLLSMVVESRFAPEIQTVGEAIHAVLAQSGYRLSVNEASSSAIEALRSLPLPPAHRSLPPMRLAQALDTLAGPPYRRVVDPVHRLVSFELTESARAGVDNALLHPVDLPNVQLETADESPMSRQTSPSLSPGRSRVRVYGPTEAADTLWSIAKVLNPDPSFTIDQVMLAIFDAQPEAFERGNINWLRRGVVIRTPSVAHVAARTVDVAHEAVNAHHERWKADRADAATPLPALVSSPGNPY